MFNLIAQSGQKMYGIEEWIAESIEDMVDNDRIKYAKPGSTCIVITEDEKGQGILQKYMLYFDNKWILVEEQKNSTIITPDGTDLAALVQEAVDTALNDTIPTMVEESIGTAMEDYAKKEDVTINGIEEKTGENVLTQSEMQTMILSGGSAN